MSVERFIKVVAQDGETILGELSVQDGGDAADVNITRDWFTPQGLRDIATACNRMADLIDSNAGGA